MSACNRCVPLSCDLPTAQMLHQAVLAHHPGFFGKPREVRISKGAQLILAHACLCSVPLAPRPCDHTGVPCTAAKAPC
jgi:hypothetical protein